jgi:hypothetical protein
MARSESQSWKTAAGSAGMAALLLLGLIYIGSRGLRDFDSALIG